MDALRHSVVMRCALVGLAVVLALVTFGCDQPVDQESGTAGEAIQPMPWDLSTPEVAVRSYLDWVSFSYRMANSGIPTATMTPEEGVRVDSYIQLNRVEGRGIEQVLDSFEVISVSQETSTAVLTARESWRYRYFSLDTLAYVSEELEASYDTTYTLVAVPRGWIVATVEASADDEVQ